MEKISQFSLPEFLTVNNIVNDKNKIIQLAKVSDSVMWYISDCKDNLFYLLSLDKAIVWAEETLVPYTFCAFIAKHSYSELKVKGLWWVGGGNTLLREKLSIAVSFLKKTKQYHKLSPI